MLIRTVSIVSALALLAGCATPPMSASVPVMPAPNKPFEVFAQDQKLCQSYASQQVAGEAERANGQGFAAALIGAGLGAGIGSAVGQGRGASVGLAYGAAIGSAVGAGHSSEANYSIQQRYDIAYEQCMYAKGNQVPGFAPVEAAPPPPPNYPPPH